MMKPLFALVLAASASAAMAADTYKLDPNHTFPSIEADHNGMSTLRGKFLKNSGTVTLDRAARTGSMEITIDMASVDFGVEHLNNKLKNDIFNVAAFPTAVYKASKIVFNGEVPVRAEGELTLHGVTKPLALTINKFKCVESKMLKREVCGADASAEFNRVDFGITAGVPAFDPTTRLQIEAEAVHE
jgi:polyisoprenoid-binding protein YceI